VLSDYTEQMIRMVLFSESKCSSAINVVSSSNKWTLWTNFFEWIKQLTDSLHPPQFWLKWRSETIPNLFCV